MPVKMKQKQGLPALLAAIPVGTSIYLDSDNVKQSMTAINLIKQRNPDLILTCKHIIGVSPRSSEIGAFNLIRVTSEGLPASLSPQAD